MTTTLGLTLGEGFGLVPGVRVSELVVDLSVYELVETVVATVVSALYSSSKLSAVDSPRRESGKIIPWTSFSLRFSEMARGASVWAPGITRAEVSGASSLSPVSPDDSSSDSAENRIIQLFIVLVKDKLYLKVEKCCNLDLPHNRFASTV